MKRISLNSDLGSEVSRKIVPFFFSHPIKIFLFFAMVLVSCASPAQLPVSPTSNVQPRNDSNFKFLDKYNAALLFSGEIGPELEENLKSTLLRSERVSLVDREKTADALNELSLNQTGIIDPKNAPKLGKILSAQKLIYLKSAKGKWSLELVDVETSKLEFIRSFKIESSNRSFEELTGFLTQNLLLRNLNGLKPKNPNIKISVSSSKQTYQENESVSFSISTSEDCYVYLILLQSDGETILLFPNSFTPNHFVKANTILQIPDGKSGYILAAGEPYGKDTIKAIASRSKLNLFNTQPYGDSPFGKIEKPFESFSRGMKIIQTTVPDEDWNTSEIGIVTKEN